MTATEKDDLKILLIFGFLIIGICFIMGIGDGIDRAMEAQERHNHLSVYCQQYGAIETLCADLKAEGATNGQ